MPPLEVVDLIEILFALTEVEITSRLLRKPHIHIDDLTIRLGLTPCLIVGVRHEQDVRIHPLLKLPCPIVPYKPRDAMHYAK